ncbi:MAG: hypothetical protein ACHREM_22080 [Polyangiales bacterium]
MKKIAPRAPRRKQSEVPSIDLDKLRAKLRVIGDEQTYFMLDEAIDILVPKQLAKLVGQYMPLRDLRRDVDAPKRSLLRDVRAFDAASRRGDYYVSFDVNSKNCTETSTGTRAFIADCRRLLDRCVAEVPKGDVTATREAFEIVVALLRYIDEANDDVIFFADEGGAWLVGIDWRKVFPAWFRCVAKTTEPDEFARIVVEAIDAFESFSRGVHLATARKLASPAQRKALDALSSVTRSQQ